MATTRKSKARSSTNVKAGAVQTTPNITINSKYNLDNDNVVSVSDAEEFLRLYSDINSVETKASLDFTGNTIVSLKDLHRMGLDILNKCEPWLLAATKPELQQADISFNNTYYTYSIVSNQDGTFSAVRSQISATSIDDVVTAWSTFISSVTKYQLMSIANSGITIENTGATNKVNLEGALVVHEDTNGDLIGICTSSTALEILQGGEI